MRNRMPISGHGQRKMNLQSLQDDCFHSKNIKFNIYLFMFLVCLLLPDPAPSEHHEYSGWENDDFQM